MICEFAGCGKFRHVSFSVTSASGMLARRSLTCSATTRVELSSRLGQPLPVLDPSPPDTKTCQRINPATVECSAA